MRALGGRPFSTFSLLIAALFFGLPGLPQPVNGGGGGNRTRVHSGLSARNVGGSSSRIHESHVSRTGDTRSRLYEPTLLDLSLT